MRRVSTFARILCLALLAVLVVPLPSDGGSTAPTSECMSATTSLKGMLNDPVAGDKGFFTVPNGPSNVMLLVDFSWSMLTIPQCGDGTNWGDTSSSLGGCVWPSSWDTIPDPTTVGAAATDGTCDVTTKANYQKLKWMADYQPTDTYADPGHGSGTNGLVDEPDWGAHCKDVGKPANSCMFDSTQIYRFNSWDDTVAPPATNACGPVTVRWTDTVCRTTAVGSSRNATDWTSTNRSETIDALPNCNSCLVGTGAKGFYFFNNYKKGVSQKKATITKSGNKYTCTNSTITGVATGGGTPTVLFGGGWLNANPPKFLSARKVIKDIAWIDPGGSTWKTDQLRLGFSMFHGSSKGTVIVPLGPAMVDSYPVKDSAYVTARQAILDAVNLKGFPSGATKPLLDYSTPMATALFHVGQYVSQVGVYNAAFGNDYQSTPRSFEVSGWNETIAGSFNASWVTTPPAGNESPIHSICWACQKTGIILVTDGSPNTEMTLPKAITGLTTTNGTPSSTDNISTAYDHDEYILTKNCGPGLVCNNTDKTKNSACCISYDTSSKIPSYLPSVAAWVHTNDLRPGLTDDPTKQTATVSTVSFGLYDGAAQQLLRATANMGGGTFNNASDGASLAAALAQAIQQVSSASNSFAAPAATALTTINAVDTKAFITRFRPSQTKSTYEGHLFQWMLFDEAAAGCDPTKKFDASDDSQKVQCGKSGRKVYANFNRDVDKYGYNLCTGSFLVDADCYEVEENPETGDWTRTQVGAGATEYYWDAGKVLSTPTAPGYRTAAEHDDADHKNIVPASRFAPDGKVARNLWTALPDGTMLELETKNAAALYPYMNLDNSWCTTMETLAKMCGDTGLPDCPVTDPTDGKWETYCAQQVILFARGWDVMDQDQDGCYGPMNPSNKATNTLADGTSTTSCAARGGADSGEERDRVNDAGVPAKTPSFYKLGDIFHSSPVLVHPPSSEALCRLGTENQCVRTLFGYTGTTKYADKYQTPLAQVNGSDLKQHYSQCTLPTGKVNAYRAWRNAYAKRENVVLVGSNDGFLHAFDSGGADPATGKPDADCVMPNVLDGTGEEIWAFMPIDVLAKIKKPMLNQGHEFTVDGNIMVRDIWVDGAAKDDNTGNQQPDDGNSLDGQKQQNEFRTIVVFGERSGGMQFTALDVTNAFDMSSVNVLAKLPHPTWKWTFPPPLSDDAQYMGQSWSDFSPRPPPIGPVRLQTSASDPDPDNKGWMEKWVVMINGGYDPTLVRGRAVWMVDAWTGGVVWRFTDRDFRTNVMNAATSNASMFPVAAGISMMDIGDISTGLDSDNFFDTATWGDLGGNVFVARFDQPGVRSGGRVVNWRAARAFEQDRQSDDSQTATYRNEFYYMTANAFEPQTSTLRTLIGSGNREHILRKGNGCGVDDVFGCCKAGCTVRKSDSTTSYGDCTSSGHFECTNGVMTSGLLDGCTSGAAQCGAPTPFTSNADYDIDCGSNGGMTLGGSASCDATGLCTINEVGDHEIAFNDTSTCANKARFYGIWTYGGPAAKTMSTAVTLTQAVADWADAQTFDKNRFTDAAKFKGTGICTFTPEDKDTGDHYCSLVDTTQAKVSTTGAVTCPSTTVACQATIRDPGWFYTYDVTCPTEAACQTVSATDDTLKCVFQKTASGAAVVNSCTTWNGFIPQGSTTSSSGSNPCSGASTSQQTAIGYASHYVTGTPDVVCNQGSDVDEHVVFRGAQRGTIAPPAAPMVRMGISQTGRVYYSTLQLDPGAPATGSGLGSRDVASTLYWLEVGRREHACRHVSGENCD